ncbi:MAG: GGDEF domain-containing protein [Acidobacteriota bacterium]
MKVLVADDDSVSRLLMQRTLQKFGYEVVQAENGRIAAEILDTCDGPRLALIDWIMPELDGPSLCRRLRGQKQRDFYTYLILLTSKESSEDIVEGLEAGADDYITKPCHPAELRARLHTGRRILSLEEKLVQAREEMRFQATHDALTSLWNRASVIAALQRELQRSVREQQPVSLLLCDVDHFKNINDTYGHLVGDFVLNEVARRLSCSVRTYDAVGRYGGEEFLVVLPGCASDSLEARAEALRSSVSSAPIEASGASPSVSISIGALTCEDWSQSIQMESLLAEADAALYRAKAEGRNCTVVSGKTSPLVK